MESSVLGFVGFGEFIFPKNWSQDCLFEPGSFLSVLSTSSKFSTCHVFYLFKLKFSMVTSCVLLSQEKKEKVKVSQKNNDNLKREKKESSKRGTISLGAHRDVRPATRISIWDYNSALLSVTDLCATYTCFSLYVPSKFHISFRSVQKNTLQSRCHFLTGITNKSSVAILYSRW